MKKIFLGLLALSLTISCGKNENTQSSTQEESFVFPKKTIHEYNVPIYENGQRKEIVRISETNFEIANDKVLSITRKDYIKGKENEISSTDTQIITYENDLPKSVITTDLKTNKLKRKQIYQYQDGKLVEMLTQHYDPNGLKIYSYEYQGDKLVKKQEKDENRVYSENTYTYVSDTQIIEEQTSYIPNNGTIDAIKEKRTYTLDAQKRVVKRIIQRENNTETAEFQYDDKKNFNYNSFLSKIFPDFFVNENLMKNNLTLMKEKNTDSNGLSERIQNNQYQYNEKGYPTLEITETQYNGANPEIETTRYIY